MVCLWTYGLPMLCCALPWRTHEGGIWNSVSLGLSWQAASKATDEGQEILKMAINKHSMGNQ